MDALDVSAMKRIALKSYELAVDKAHGEGGINAMRELIEFVIELFSHRDPEGISGTLYVVRPLESTGAAPREAVVSGAPNAVERKIERLFFGGASVIVIGVQEGVYQIWLNPEFDKEGASHSAIVYQYAARREAFLVSGAKYDLDKPIPSYASNFSRPRFSSLREALLDYAQRIVRNTTCFILQDVWEDPPRFFFRPKPEMTMRRSLHQHLRAALPDATTRAEQVVDESHPVDLRVEWDLTAQEAIIEIKWLGASRAAGKITVRYSGSRARTGARQLANYLSKSRQSAPSRQTRGYLVVIDGRRRGLRDNTTTLSRSDAMYYANKSISYSPEYHKVRDDFEEPIRMFAEPA